jgi:hypothetical protein
MPLVRCPNCGQAMGVNRAVLGEVVGCMTFQCESRFRAIEYRPHTGLMSQLVFIGVVGFAIYFAAIWLNSYYRVF